MQEVEEIGRVRCFGGWIITCRHLSRSCQHPMRFAVYLPPQAKEHPVPAVYWLSGLTCTEENFMIKAGAQRHAAEFGLALVAPDTSPRDTGTAGEDDDYDLGTGAGFYVNATIEPWKNHYRMYDYVFGELIGLVEQTFPIIDQRRGISGHSMGGHGALMGSLSNPGLFQSVTAFAPICAPSKCPWGRKAFSSYLGDAEADWAAYDTSILIANAREQLPILVDQGGADPFLEEQLMPDALRAACESADYPLTLRIQDGYDHSYFFIQSYIAEHLRYHAERLGVDKVI